MKKVLAILTLIYLNTILACSNPNEGKVESNITELEELNLLSEENHSFRKATDSLLVDSHFYKFDEIEHFSLIKNSIDVLDYEKDLSETEEKIKEMLLNKKNIDLKFLNKLEGKYFSRRNLNSDQKQQINQSFTFKKPPSEYTSTACVKVYRDILVFKSNKKVVGVTKVCLSCDGVKFFESLTPTYSWNDYSLLKKILSNKK